LIGSRLSMLVMTFTPAITALIGYVALSENLNFYQIFAILLIIIGILMAFVGFDKGQFRFKLSLKGFLFAVGGAMGQSLGLIFGKKGIVDYDPFAATQIRIITGFMAFTLLIMVLNHWPSIIRAVSERKAMKAMVLGSFFGPFLGVALSMFAIMRTQTGIASALMALTPMVLLIPALLKGRRIANREWIGALISVGGVALLFI
jgi:drug/metabolite transporter (DMT)-like permease